VADGRLRVEGIPALSPDTPLASGLRMRHFIHRHEPPVPAGSVTVVGITEDLVAVHKPHGMPVHVAGQYRKNTVLGILSAERPELLPLLPAHRLDRPVSGVLLFARNSVAADVLRLKIQRHEVEKVYVARVQGAFPATGADGGPLVVSRAPLGWDPATNMAFEAEVTIDEPTAEAEAEVAVEAAGVAREAGQEGGGGGGGAAAEEEEAGAPAAAAPDGALSRKQKKKRARPSKEERVAAARAAAAAAAAADPRAASRHAETRFRLLHVAPDGLTSIVECRPQTGRTHQIRVHLAGLGHPVANDEQYGGRYAGPISSRTLARQLGVSWEDLARERGDGPRSVYQPAAVAAAAAEAPAAPAAPEGVRAGDAFRGAPAFEAPPALHDPHCAHCPYFTPLDYPTDLRPLWLHARTYECQEWAFTAEPPAWADPEWTPTLP
jgi:23S rRNA-/tRNA-specific pseudouridylate synthase